MLTILDDSPNLAAAAAVLPTLEQSYEQVRQLLPTLPADINIWLDNSVLIPETGEGGFAYSPSTITIAFDLDYADKTTQLQRLRATIFHESYHLVQGHTNEESSATYTTALNSAIYEGMATIFEREFANSSPLWGNYSSIDKRTLSQWRDELLAIPIADYLNPDTGKWQQWASYDKADGTRWKLYKTGTWVVDEYLRDTGKGILEVARMHSSEIIDTHRAAAS